jgi:hypothetical protein
MDIPVLLTLEDLNDPIDVQRYTLADIRDCLEDALEGAKVMTQGLFVLAISGLETMLSDIYLTFIRAVPAACDFGEGRFTRNAILEAASPLDLLEGHLENQTIALAYKSFTEVLRKVTATLAIAEPWFDGELLARLVEAKETRNLILHTNLRVNQAYVAKAGARRRSETRGASLPLTGAYVRQTLDDLDSLIAELHGRINDKYAAYTRLRAFRQLWAYLFSSPIMPIDDFWNFDDANDKVYSIKRSPLEGQLSSSEQMFLGVLRVHFNDYHATERSVHMRLLDPRHQRTLLWLLQILRDLRFS